MQALATGDWVPCIAADVAGVIISSMILPINTTHDDIEFDVDCDTVKPDIWRAVLEVTFNRYLETAFPILWKEWTGQHLLVPLKIKAKLITKGGEDKEEVIEDDDRESDGDGSEPIE
jgi:hypothetical protein